MFGGGAEVFRLEELSSQHISARALLEYRQRDGQSSSRPKLQYLEESSISISSVRNQEDACLSALLDSPGLRLV